MTKIIALDWHEFMRGRVVEKEPCAMGLSVAAIPLHLLSQHINIFTAADIVAGCVAIGSGIWMLRTKDNCNKTYQFFLGVSSGYLIVRLFQ